MSDRLRPVASPPPLARILLRLRTPSRPHEWMAGDLEEAITTGPHARGCRPHGGLTSVCERRCYCAPPSMAMSIWSSGRFFRA